MMMEPRAHKSKFGRYSGKDQTFAQKFEDGGDVMEAGKDVVQTMIDEMPSVDVKVPSKGKPS